MKMYDNHVMLYIVLGYAQEHKRADREQAATEILLEITQYFGETYRETKERYRYFIGFF